MLTYEIIRDLERAEKESKKLQKIPESVVEEINGYLKKKESIHEKTSSDIHELENVKHVITGFFECRTDKIIQLAAETVKTPLPVHPQNLTKEEDALFDRLVETLQGYRETFFTEIRKPEIIRKEAKATRYRVRKSMPEFMGPDMNVYKLNENDIVNLPEPLNEFLVKKGVIEPVEE